MKDSQERKRARGMDRAFAILDHLRAARTPQRPAEIAQALGAPKSTIYELVGALIGHGMLEQDEDTGTVFLGRRLYFLGLAYRDHFDLTRKAEKSLEQITAMTRETSQFCMLDGNKYTVALQREGSRPFRISADVGERTPIPWTASGRLLLGNMSNQEIMDLIPPEDFILPSGEQLDLSTYLSEIREAHAAGFFSFDSIADTFTHCFAAPVYDRKRNCVATVCIVAPKDDARQNYETYKTTLKQSGLALSQYIP